MPMNQRNMATRTSYITHQPLKNASSMELIARWRITTPSNEFSCFIILVTNNTILHRNVSIHVHIPHVLVAFVEGALQGLFDERPGEYVRDTKRPNAEEYICCPRPAFEGAVPHQ
jgi:hypothetical protein